MISSQLITNIQHNFSWGEGQNMQFSSQLLFFYRYFVKIIHKKKALLKVAFWNENTHARTTCRNHRSEIDIESKWVYSHIKLSSYFRYVLFQVITQFDMVANPL